jgi:hypothetical protein
LVKPAECSRYAGGQAEESEQFERTAKEPIEGRASGMLEYQHRPSEVMSERKRPSRPVRIKLVSKGIFVLKPLQAFQSGAFRDRGYHENRGQFPVSPPGVNDVLFAFP